MMKGRWAAVSGIMACWIMIAGGAYAAMPTPASDKYDTTLPVEISADNLEVFQHENRAVFKGNVIAVQGKVRLNSDVMIVHYKQQDSAPGAAKPAAPTPPMNPTPGGDAGAMGAITLIEVQGHVFMATPEESAKGDHGDYHVPERVLNLYGDNVILTRDKNILRGTHLIYNLETGHSVLTNNGATVTGPNGGRVRGVFIPNQDPKKQDKQPDTKTAVPVPGGEPAR